MFACAQQFGLGQGQIGTELQDLLELALQLLPTDETTCQEQTLHLAFDHHRHVNLAQSSVTGHAGRPAGRARLGVVFPHLAGGRVAAVFALLGRLEQIADRPLGGKQVGLSA